MRYFTYGVGAALVFELEVAGAVKRIIHDGRDIIHLELISGESLMIHLIDSAIPLYEIRQTAVRNTKAGHHTLFILWSDMLLPDAGRIVTLEDWHQGLLALNQGTIYAYKLFMQRLYVFPVYFDAIPGQYQHRVRYGDALDVGKLHCSTVDIRLNGMAGRYFVADFDGDPDHYHRQRAEDIGQPLPGALQEYYALLGVDPGTSAVEIKRAYRRLARQYHPDLSIDTESTSKMQEINRAYAVIIKSLESS